VSAARPDPALGIFETLLVVDGRPIELDAHLARLGASARELFGDAAEARTRGPTRALAEARAREVGPTPGRAREVGPAPGPHVSATDPAAGAGAPSPALGRLRLTMAPDDRGGLDISAAAAAVDPALVFPTPEAVPRLVPVTVAGGLGLHKWADRRALEAAAAEAGAGAAGGGRVLTLIVDEDGAVLEAERANVFAVIDGVLVTPPADGRILPGVTRTRVMEVAKEIGVEAREAGFSLDELDAADEAFLTGSVRCIESLRTPTPSSATARLAAELRRRWLG
jgi:para-aminobenzoate synthetase/4-amino-4-deoxychorismate lyase